MMTDYVRLLEANNAIQTIGDDTYWLCVTRTVQESKLFPVPSYMLSISSDDFDGSRAAFLLGREMKEPI